MSGSGCTPRSASGTAALVPDAGSPTPRSHGPLRVPVWGRGSFSEPCVASSARSKSRSPGPVALRCNPLGRCSYVSPRLTHERGLWSSLESCPPGTPGAGEGDRAPTCHPPGSQTSNVGRSAHAEEGRLLQEVGLVRGLHVEENQPGLLRALPPSLSPGTKRPEPQVTPGQSEGDGLGGHADFHGAAGGRPWGSCGHS